MPIQKPPRPRPKKPPVKKDKDDPANRVPQQRVVDPLSRHVLQRHLPPPAWGHNIRNVSCRFVEDPSYAFGGHWDTDEVVMTPLPYERMLISRDTYDNPMWRDSCIQDCVTSRYSLDSNVDAHSNVGGGLTRDSPILTVDGINLSAGAGRYITVPAYETLLRMGERDNTRAFHPDMLFRRNAARLYTSMKYKPLTKSFTLDSTPFDEEFSVWFLVKDLYDLPKLARSFLRPGKLAQFPNLFRRVSMTMAECAKVALAMGYGVLPTIHDMKDFYEIVLKWGAYDKKQKIAMARLFHERNPPKGVPDMIRGGSVVRNWIYESPHLAGAACNLTCTSEVDEGKLYAILKHYFVMPEVHGVLGRCMQAVDRLGLIDPAAAWDMVPYTFLLDWFVDIGKYLNRVLKFRLLPVTPVVCDWGESLGANCKYTITATYKCPTYGGGVHEFVNVPICHGRGLQYIRRRQFPDDVEIDVKGQLVAQGIATMHRAIMGSALVSSRLKVIPQYKRRAHYRKRRIRVLKALADFGDPL